MGLFSWLRERFSDRGKALVLYKRGMGKAKIHDHKGAIADYTATIEMNDAPQDVVAMSLYNRALVHVASGDDAQATTDLNAVLEMNSGHVNIRTMAKQLLFRMDTRQKRDDGWQSPR